MTSECIDGDCSQRKVWERLKAYEDTGLEPEEIKAHEEEFIELTTLSYGPVHKKIGQWLKADRDGRLVVLPIAIGKEVFTIEESYFDCDNCEHGAKAKYDPIIARRCCMLDKGEHCPYYIKGHIVKGFTIGAGYDGKSSLSDPGEWGYEGLEEFSGIDGKWYPTHEAAEVVMKGGDG